ncbi:MAG: acyl-CoA dehydrogenase family protein [Deltaproteobacteria bacterium]|nr:acyl-CoA dehydrogenase family protein [Deltaproteobacteria bacterium]MBW2415726.1 acyl-CoA dehydrogenase family protein [Deltaproteobacteria bacterium]
MDFHLSPEEEKFRGEVRAFLDENLPVTDIKRWLRNVREKRWVGFSWPEEVGGGGGQIMQQVILKEEMAKRKAPPLGTDMMGLAWVGPSIIQYGTEEQKRRFIPEILDSKYHWCTGYSEPGSGSDLASLQCKGVLEGDEYVVNGQKIWTSLAPFAKWMILLVRTDFETKVKHQGITCLLVDMKTPGIEVRPIKTMAGTSFFAEVFFNDVRVPADHRLGAEGQGWQVTISALASERSSIAEVEALQRKLEQVKELARGARKNGRAVLEDAGLRRRLARIETKIEAMRLNGMRFLTKQLKGDPLGSETSINKLHRAELEVEFGEVALELLGGASPYVKGSEAAVDGGRWQATALSWPEVVIGGGTPNIQKNIIAERILRLPKD